MPANLSFPAATSTSNFYSRIHDTQGKDALANGLPPSWQDFIDWLDSSAVSLPANARILDAGCGLNAFYARTLLQRFDGTEAIDINQSAISNCLKICPELKVRLGSVLDLPFDDATFDLVICAGVAHHTPDPARAIRELARVLKPGGTAYISIYSFHRSLFEVIVRSWRMLGRFVPYSLAHRLFNWSRSINNFVLDHTYVPVLWIFTADEVIRLLAEVGLTCDRHWPSQIDPFQRRPFGKLMTRDGLLRYYICHKAAD